MEADLGDMLERTLEEATLHSKNVFGGDHAMSAEDLTRFLNESEVAPVCSITPTGAPHITDVGIVLVCSNLYLGMGRSTALHRNLRVNKNVAVAVIEPPWRCHVLIQGTVRSLTRGSDELRKVWDAERAKHGWG